MNKSEQEQINAILMEADAHCIALNKLIRDATKLSVSLTIEDCDDPIRRLVAQFIASDKEDSGIEPKLIQWRAEMVELKRTPLAIRLGNYSMPA